MKIEVDVDTVALTVKDFETLITLVEEKAMLNFENCYTTDYLELKELQKKLGTILTLKKLDEEGMMKFD